MVELIIYRADLCINHYKYILVIVHRIPFEIHVCIVVFVPEGVLCLLQGEGIVVLAGLAVPHQVTGLFTQPEQRLCIGPTDCSMVPATRDEGGKEQWKDIKKKISRVFSGVLKMD